MSKTDLDIPLRVKATYELAPGYTGIVFERPRALSYEAGDWLDIRLPNADVPGGKTYSFASSPTEPDVLIAYKHGGSPFKRALIAGGIGVAPFRSMIKEVVDQHESADISLLYLHQTDDFPYRDELDTWAPGHQNARCTDIVKWP